MPPDLLAFEEDIAAEFKAGRIKAPVHLSGGNEEQLFDIFREIQNDDWVLAGWRSHYHCLLKGVPRNELKAAIMAGQSVSLCFPRYKILCSGIVGGIAPIAVGLAWAIKRKQDASPYGHESKVWCFLGDMTAETGIVHEAMKYANGHGLLIGWVEENNGYSVCTHTQTSWGSPTTMPRSRFGYTYKLTRPHVGIGEWVRF